MDILGYTCVAVLVSLTLLGAYQWALAVTVMLSSRSGKIVSLSRQVKFLLLIPAHNEELGLADTLKSVADLQYPKELVHVVVVADWCHDATAAVAHRYGVECLERSSGQRGKGAAIAWAIKEVRNNRSEFDALVILDADTLVDQHLLEAFDQDLLSGHQVQQAYNYLSNPWESPFTRIIAVTSVLRNGFFYAGKSRLGLSGMLTGTGMCLSREVIERHGWTAFSVGEDWEFSVSLLKAGLRIHFNRLALVLARESHDLKHASRQRLRWASGRYAVVASSALGLFRKGLRQRSAYLVDSALTLLAPNYSTQISLAIMGLFASLFLAGDPSWGFVFTWSVIVVVSLGAYFILGVFFTEAPWKALAGIPLIPILLPWRVAIELLGFLGYGRGNWGRTSRTSMPGRRTPQ